METEIAKVALAVPGSLGIVLAIATFGFMAWFIKDNQKQNEKREERLAGIIERDLVNQKEQLSRLEEAAKFQRAEHETIINGQKDSTFEHNKILNILERVAGMLSNHNGNTQKT